MVELVGHDSQTYGAQAAYKEGQDQRKTLPGTGRFCNVTGLLNHVDVGAGVGKELSVEIELGEYGLILDGRNRPLSIETASPKKQQDIFKELELL